MRENRLQYRIHGTPVPTMRTRGTNYHESTVKARTGRVKQTLQVLWARYTTTPAQPGQRHYSYDRFRQLVASHVDVAGGPAPCLVDTSDSDRVGSGKCDDSHVVKKGEVHNEFVPGISTK